MSTRPDAQVSNASPTRFGDSSDDVIAATWQMRFDWVPDAGNSFTWMHEWGDWWAPMSESGSEPSKASGYVIFDTPDLAQAFTTQPTEPNEFSFQATRGWIQDTRGWMEGFWSMPYSQWVWNPETGGLAPSFSTFLSGYSNPTRWFDERSVSQVDFSSFGDLYDLSSEKDHGRWILQQTGDMTAFGGAGDDTIYGGTGTDALFGQTGNDTLHGGLGEAVLSGGAGADTLIGGAGAQTLDGGTGKDLLIAGSGRQILRGDEGRDTLRDGKGDAIMSGGPGADTFDFITGGGADIVQDFSVRNDHIVLAKSLYDTAHLPAIGTGAGPALLDFANGHTLMLMGVTGSELKAHADSVFLFA